MEKNNVGAGTDDEPLLFALRGSEHLGQAVSRALSIPLSRYEQRAFPDGEHKTRPLVNVRGRDVFVIHSLFGDTEQTVNDKLCRLLFFIGALNDASAAGVTAVTPYLCYTRKDRRTNRGDPLTIQYIARMFEAIGVDRVLTCDVHNLAAYQNAFRCRAEHLVGWVQLVPAIDRAVEYPDVVVVSPDAGGFKRAQAFRDRFEQVSGKEVTLAVMEKRRSEGVVSGDQLFGDVQGRTAVVVDDMISTGTTMTRTIESCRQCGARRVFAAATHGLFVGDDSKLLAHPFLRQLFVTNTVESSAVDETLAEEKLTVVDCSPRIAEAISDIHAARPA